ncbi:MAG: methyltransferase domain-containing protein [Burkholderiales bacterium]|nr:methyltransferase domain-containing protein [Burkholderiales bacterium]
MDDNQRKALLKKTFDTVAEGYGSTGMEFFHHAAAHLPRIFKLQGHEHLLDVATGTGIAATAIAPHLPRGRVTGIDLSEGMLAQARARARAQSQALDNIELHPMDMQNIGFDNAHFDAANCSFGIFFLPDMLSLLQHIASKVKPGGQVVACSFYQGSFEPNVDLFLERIQRYGIAPPEFTWKGICTEEKFYALYTGAGLDEVQIHRHEIGYPLHDAEAWWRVIWYAGFRGLVAQLSDTELVQFKQEHLAEIAALKTDQGIPLNITALFASGRAQ